VKPATLLFFSMAEYQHRRHKESDMNTLALSTLTFHALATVTMVLGAAVNACRPFRRSQG
jgi:hypothetical protein